jgi:ABC-type polysaccharide/polyol phosphate export permease
MWALLMPTVIIIAGIFVKKVMAILSGNPLNLEDILSMSVKALPWTFFIGAIKMSTNSLVGNLTLVTKIYFPREVCPLAAIFSTLFDFSIASFALIVFLLIAKTGASIYLLWLPVVLIILIFFITGLGMILACLNLFFRDVKYLVEVILTFAIFFTPVFYEVSMFEKWKTILLLNPIAPILETISTIVILHRPPDFLWLSYSAMWAFGGFFVFWKIFIRTEPNFAENI